jgi:hypothetical protein
MAAPGAILNRVSTVAGQCTSNTSGTAPDTLDKAEKIDSDNVSLVATKRGWSIGKVTIRTLAESLLQRSHRLLFTPEISYHAVAILCPPNRESEAIRFLDAAVQHGQPFSGLGDAKHLRMQFLTEKTV